MSKELGPLASPFPGKNLFGRADPAKRQRELEAWLRELALAVAPAPAAYAAFTSFIREPPDATLHKRRREARAAVHRPSRPRRRPTSKAAVSPPNGTVVRVVRPARRPRGRACRNRFHEAGAQTQTSAEAAARTKARGRGRPEIPADDGARDVPDGERQDLRRDGRSPRDAIKAGDLQSAFKMCWRDGALASYQDRQTESMPTSRRSSTAVVDRARARGDGRGPDGDERRGRVGIGRGAPSLRSKLTAARGSDDDAMCKTRRVLTTVSATRSREGAFELPR